MYGYTPEDDVRMAEEAGRKQGYHEGIQAARKEMMNMLQMPGIIESRCLDADVIQRVRDGMWGSLMVVTCKQWADLKNDVKDLRQALSAYTPWPEDAPEE